jgi:thiamine monophosphate synthase
VRSGADGIAVVSAISAAADPRRAAEDLRRRIDRLDPRVKEHST